MKLAATIALLASPLALAQAPPVPSLRTETNVVLVPALVRNPKGELVFTLKAGDFRVTDDGVEQRLTLDEYTAGEPLALVVAVETGSAGARKLASYRDLSGVLAALVGGVPHRVAVVGFDSAPRLLQDFDPDTDAAAATLAGLEPGDKGGAILDALAFSVNLLRSQPPAYRRAILLLSETVDHGSQAKLDDALRAIGDTNTAIFALAFSSAKASGANQASKTFQPDTPGPAGGCMAKDPNAPAPSTASRLGQAYDCLSVLAPPLRLAKAAAMAATEGLKRNVPETVAQVTGGEYFKFESSRGLVSDLLTISNHVPNRYMLSFQPQSPHPGFHAVELRLKDAHGMRVTARSGYWADGDSATVQPPGLSR